MNDERLKSYMQERLGGYEHPVDGTLWASLEKSIPPKSRKLNLPLIISGAAVAVIAFALLLLVPSADDGTGPATITEDYRPETPASNGPLNSTGENEEGGQVQNDEAPEILPPTIRNHIIPEEEPIAQADNAHRDSDLPNTENEPLTETPSGNETDSREKETPDPGTEKRRPANGYPPYPYQSPKKGRELSMMLAFNGTPSATIVDYNETVTSPEPGEVVKGMGEETVHDFPISFTLAVRKGLSPKFAIESGLTYTYLHSRDKKAEIDLKQHYIGIPIKGVYTYFDSGRLSLYASAGGMVEKQVAGRVKIPGYNLWYVYSTLQVSVSAAAGVQYKPGNNIGLFAEPGVNYYFDNGANFKNIRKDRPLNFGFQLGVRFDLN